MPSVSPLQPHEVVELLARAGHHETVKLRDLRNKTVTVTRQEALTLAIKSPYIGHGSRSRVKFMELAVPAPQFVEHNWRSCFAAVLYPSPEWGT